MSKREPLLCAWRCTACECGPCILSTKAVEDRPYFCACCHDDEVECEWVQIKTVADSAYNVYAWKHDVAEEWIGERNYPDWFWLIIAERWHDGGEIVEDLGAAAYDDRFSRITSRDNDFELDKVLKKYTKRELFQALIPYGFKCGVMYTEWRRKADGVDDYEIYSED